MVRVKVVGVGASPKHLTLEAIEELKKAKKVYGSRRALKNVEDFIKDKEKIIIEDFNKIESYLEDEKDEAVFLSTGDPMVSGLGSFLKKKGIDIIIVPGISSVQLALAKLKIDLCESCVVDWHKEHGNDIEIEKILELGRNVIILANKNLNIENLMFIAEKFGAELFICEDLGYSSEKITKMKKDRKPYIRSSLIIAVIKVK